MRLCLKEEGKGRGGWKYSLPSLAARVLPWVPYGGRGKPTPRGHRLTSAFAQVHPGTALRNKSEKDKIEQNGGEKEELICHFIVLMD